MIRYFYGYFSAFGNGQPRERMQVDYLHIGFKNGLPCLEPMFLITSDRFTEPGLAYNGPTNSDTGPIDERMMRGRGDTSDIAFLLNTPPTGCYINEGRIIDF